MYLGVGGWLAEEEGITIPKSWEQGYERLRELRRKPVVALVVGEVDSGKSSFCTFLLNKLVSDGCRVAVLDEDLGQSDIGPPATIAWASVQEPITDLFSLDPLGVVFVGSTSPVGAQRKTLEAATQLKTEILTWEKVDFLVVNTDGWILGEEATQFKLQVIKALNPDVVFCLYKLEAPQLFCEYIEKTQPSFKIVQVESPVTVRERNMERRRNLRELGFANYMTNARLQTYPLSQIEAETENGFELANAENRLVALCDAKKRFLGIGVLRRVDSQRKIAKIFTAVKEKPSTVILGKVKLDHALREIQEQPNRF